MASDPSTRESGGRPVQQRRINARGWNWLLPVPLLGTLVPPIYNSQDPTLFGIPFFYWYQLAWIPLSALCTFAVHRAWRASVGRPPELDTKGESE